MRSLMKVEFRNTPVYFRGSAFNEFKSKVPCKVSVPVVEPLPAQISAQVPSKITVPIQNADSVVISNKEKIATVGSLAGGLGAIIWGLQALKGKGVSQNAVDSVAQTVSDASASIFKQDLAYIKNLAKSMGLADGQEVRLKSIMGKFELKELLVKYSPEDFRIGQNLDGAKDRTFRVNLHNHTQYSDGKLSVRDFLDQSAKYADKVAETNPNDGKPPFTIAITDHDTMEGCKEALKIIAENPDKYKNLRVVLGSEISVSNSDSNIVSRPLNFELVGYCQNPYDEKLVKLLDNIQKTRQQNAEEFLEEINQQMPQYNLNIEEAKSFHSNLKNMRTNGILYLTGDYAKFKISLVEYVKQINKFLPKSVEKLSPEQLFRQLGDDYYYRMDAYGERDMKTYFKDHGLKNILKSKNLHSQKNKNTYSGIFDMGLNHLFDFVDKTVQKNLPTLSDRKNYTLSPEKVFASTTEGFYGFAHPGVIDFGYDNISSARKKMCDENSFHYSQNLVYEIFNSLKQSGKELFAASEINYQSYPKYVDKSWIDFMKRSIADNSNLNLLYTGGVDAHKPSIFTKHSYLDDITLQEIFGEI